MYRLHVMIYLSHFTDNFTKNKKVHFFTEHSEKSYLRKIIKQSLQMLTVK